MFCPIENKNFIYYKYFSNSPFMGRLYPLLLVPSHDVLFFLPKFLEPRRCDKISENVHSRNCSIREFFCVISNNI